MMSDDLGIESGDETDLTNSRDWQRNVESKYKDGLRDGISEGRDKSLQDGFNCSYQLGFDFNNTCAQLRGILTAVLSRLESGTNDDERSEIERLISTLSREEIKFGKLHKSREENTSDSAASIGNASSEEYSSIQSNKCLSDEEISEQKKCIEQLKQDCHKILKSLNWNVGEIDKVMDSID